MKMLDMHEIRLTYEADLPARSGLGTSSSFAVGMLNAFYALKGRYADKKKLANEAIYLERNLCQEGSVLAESLQGALPAIALDGHPALSTAYMNDCEPLLCFAQQVNGYGKAEDVFLGISTSGNSKNVLYAATTAHAKGMKVIGLEPSNYYIRFCKLLFVCISSRSNFVYLYC